MPQKCKEIVYMFYYHKFSLESISERIGYSSTDAVKTRKNQCMKKLKLLLLEKI